MRSQIVMTSFMSCSISEQEQLRLRGQRAGDLQSSLVAVGEAFGHVIEPVGEAQRLQQLQGAGFVFALAAEVLRRAEDRAEQIVAGGLVDGDEDVFQNAQAGD